MMGGFGLGGILFGGLMMVVFWVLVIVGVVWLVATVARGGQPHISAPVSSQTPQDVLKARYAKGEITKEQYDQMKSDLG